MYTIMTITANVLGIIATLTLVVLFLASGANAKPAMLVQIKWFLIASLVVGLGCICLSAWALWQGRDWLAIGSGVFPVLFAIVFLAVLYSIRW